MIYQPTVWRDNRSPSISAFNLNHIEQGIQQCSKDTIASVSLQSSGDNLTITLTTQEGTNISYTFDIVTWLSSSAFYTQAHINASIYDKAYIDSCFTEEQIGGEEE